MHADASYTFTLYERPRSAFWWVKVYVTGEGGAPRRRSTGVEVGTNRRESHREASRAAEGIAARLAEEVGLASTAATAASYALSEVADRMLTTKEANGKRRRTLATHAWNLDKYALPFFGAARDIRTIKRIDLEQFKAHLRGKLKLQPQSINNALTALRQVLKHAALVEELLDVVPQCANVATSNESKGRALTPEEFKKLIDSVDPRAVEAKQWLIFLANTGLRKSEALAMRWGWVSFEEKVLRIPAAFRKGGKYGAVLPLNNTAVAVLAERRDHGRKRVNQGKIIPLPTGPEDRVWLQVKHDEARNSAAKRAGLGRVRNHDLRHTVGSMAYASGASLPEVRDLLGHTTLAMVSRYAHSYPERLRSVVDGLQLYNASATPPTATIERGDKPKDETVLPSGEARPDKST